VDIQQEVLRSLDEALGLNGRSRGFGADTALFGSLPELDSMAVVDLITSLEDRLGVAFEDDEITAQTFATVGSLTGLVRAKLAA
jgi:acyl carrier protein